MARIHRPYHWLEFELLPPEASRLILVGSIVAFMVSMGIYGVAPDWAFYLVGLFWAGPLAGWFFLFVLRFIMFGPDKGLLRPHDERKEITDGG